VGGPKALAFEEGPLAHWLRRNLLAHVDRLVVCDPRRNAYIAKDGDKDDAIDAAKLAELLRGDFLREVYHSDDDASVRLKRWVQLYHDRTQAGTREINKLRACCRHQGVRPVRRVLRDPVGRQAWLATLDDADLREQLTLRWLSLDAIVEQVRHARRQVHRLSRPFEIIGLWQAVPGIGLIRAATLRAYLDTPWRFRTREKLWKYVGVGLERTSSGKDRAGRPVVGRLQLGWAVNKRLKDAVMGATLSAIRQGHNGFAAQYERKVRDGLTPAKARHTVARKLVTVLWAMWKTHQPFDPAYGLGPADEASTRRSV
jgi:transposase